MSTQPTEVPALAGAIRCILRDIARSIGRPLADLPGKFDAHQTALILGLTTSRTLDTWASRPDQGGLPFMKVGRSRRYLLSDIVTFTVARRSDACRYGGAAVADAVFEQIERLGASSPEASS